MSAVVSAEVKLRIKENSSNYLRASRCRSVNHDFRAL